MVVVGKMKHPAEPPSRKDRAGVGGGGEVEIRNTPKRCIQDRILGEVKTLGHLYTVLIGKVTNSTSVFHSSNLATLFYCLFLLITWLLLPYINSIFHFYSLIHSDEGLTLETTVFECFTVANLPYRPCG